MCSIEVQSVSLNLTELQFINALISVRFYVFLETLTFNVSQMDVFDWEKSGSEKFKGFDRYSKI